MNQTLIIRKKDAEELLTMDACIRAMEETFRDISAGKTTMLQRSMMPQKKGNTFALMASDNQQQEICGVKTIVFPGSEAKKNGTSQGIIPLPLWMPSTSLHCVPLPPALRPPVCWPGRTAAPWDCWAPGALAGCTLPPYPRCAPSAVSLCGTALLPAEKPAASG